jgi:lysophospholipase L1-like esterase
MAIGQEELEETDRRATGARPRAPAPPRRTWPVLAGVGALEVVAVVLLALAGTLWSRWALVLATALVVVAVVGGAVVRWRIDSRRPSGRVEGVPVVLVLGLVVVVAGGAGALHWALDGGPDVVGVLGASLALIGAGHVVAELRAMRAGAPARGLLVLALCAALVTGALDALGRRSSGAAWGSLAAGILLSPVAIGLLTEDVLDRLDARDVPDHRHRAIAQGAAACVLAGLAALVLVVHVPPGYAVGAAVVLTLAVGAVASNTTTDAALVLCVLALAWSVVPRSVPPTEHVLIEDGETVLVAMGDSYMSGEGARTYYEGTNHQGTNECRRAPSAYPPEVVRRDDASIPDDVVFLACSGATTSDIAAPAGAGAAEGEDAAEADQLRQLARVRADHDIDLGLVVVSIGGNDARFGDVARTCVAPGDCSVLRDRWLDALTDVGPAVTRTYAAIRTAVGPDVPVVALPYPVPLNDSGCSWSALTGGEHRFLADFTRRLDGVLRGAAADAGVHFLDEMVTAFADEDLRLCDRGPSSVGVNFLAANPVEGLMRDRIDPRNWFHNSLHPNARGHRAMAAVLADWIEAHPDLPATPPSAGDTSAASAADTRAGGDAGEGGDAGPGELADASESTDRWALDQTLRLVRLAAAPTLLIAFGAWLLWVEIFRRGRRRRAASAGSGP